MTLNEQNDKGAQAAECGKSAIVAIIGRPSCGKSTFLNTVCGEKVSIVSAVPQTTRNSIRGIVNRERGQLVFIDTPGYHLSEKKMNIRLASLARSALEDADAVLYLIDSTRDPGEEEERIAELILPYAEKTVIALNKTDSPDSRTVPARLFIENRLPQFPSSRVFEISAHTKAGIDSALESLYDLSPAGPEYYPKEFYTDQEVDFRIAEIIREQAVNLLYQELPHMLYVEIADMEQRNNGKTLWVRAFIVVERESQKGMVIGKGATMIKTIRKNALKQLKRIFDYTIDLDLQVKVHKNWRQKDPLLNKLLS